MKTPLAYAVAAVAASAPARLLGFAHGQLAGLVHLHGPLLHAHGKGDFRHPGPVRLGTVDDSRRVCGFISRKPQPPEIALGLHPVLNVRLVVIVVRRLRPVPWTLTALHTLVGSAQLLH